ncbi:uncharacterized protein (TIGR02284 family) [Flavobacteriaceae bacterium MAR_2009_75]|nr:uncharacterized protein (TIGR02284 family) [Flavobacteriaceae bacterium MAR_2009_75]
MENKIDNIYDEIREILKKNRDAQEGFAKAAENVRSPALKNYFERKSNDRKDFNEKLLAEIRNSFPDREIEGSFSGTIHRAWMDFKALFSADDDKSMLDEVIRGDKAAIEEYNEVLDYKLLPIGLNHLLSEQRERIITDVRNNATVEDIE